MPKAQFTAYSLVNL